MTPTEQPDNILRSAIRDVLSEWIDEDGYAAGPDAATGEILARTLPDGRTIAQHFDGQLTADELLSCSLAIAITVAKADDLSAEARDAWNALRAKLKRLAAALTTGDDQ